MCGIFGEFGEVLTPKNLFMDILKLSQERGPDMIGYFKDNNIQFGFNRLSILEFENFFLAMISSLVVLRYYLLCRLLLRPLAIPQQCPTLHLDRWERLHFL